MNWLIFRYNLKKTCFIRLILLLKCHLEVANNFFGYSGLSSVTNDINESMWSKNTMHSKLRDIKSILKRLNNAIIFFFENLKKFVKYQYDTKFPFKHYLVMYCLSLFSFLFIFLCNRVFFLLMTKKGAGVIATSIQRPMMWQEFVIYPFICFWEWYTCTCLAFLYAS